MAPGMFSCFPLFFQLLICMLSAFVVCFVHCLLGLSLLNMLYNCLYVAVIVLLISNILEEIICYILFSIMVSESEVFASGSSGASAGVIDWTTYSFPQPVELTSLPEKFNGGIGFSRWQKKMKL